MYILKGLGCMLEGLGLPNSTPVINERSLLHDATKAKHGGTHHFGFMLHEKLVQFIPIGKRMQAEVAVGFNAAISLASFERQQQIDAMTVF